MENQVEKRPEEKEERKIPVFTVLKNGAVLKNIFVINKPPSPSAVSAGSSGPESITSVENAENPDQETEEILIVGRHPDCNIALMHPSISRFHLQINSKPSSQRLFVTDLSSVHGTWVSGKKIEPGVRVELRASDTIRVGGSTRLYKLHWVPLSSANDTENQFVLPQDMSMIEEIEDEKELLEEGDELKMFQDENLLPAGSILVNDKVAAIVEEIGSAHMRQDNELLATEVKPVEESAPLEVAGMKQGAYEEMNSVENGEIQALNSVSDGVLPLFSDENCGFIAIGDVPVAPLMLENKNSSFSDDTEDIEGQSRNVNELEEILNSILTREVSFVAKTQQFDEHSNLPAYHFAKEAIPGNGSIEGSLRSDKESNCWENLDYPLPFAELEAPPAIDMAEQTINQCLLGTTNEQLIFHPLVTEHVNFSLPGGDMLENSQKINEEDQTEDPPYALWPLYEDGKRQNSTPHHTTPQILDEVENQILSEKHDGQTELTSVCSPLLKAESVNSSFPVDEVLSEIAENKEAQISQSMFTATENKENSNANLEANQTEDPPYALWPLDENGKRQNSTPHNATPQILEEVENQILSKMHDGQTEFTSVCSALLKAESVNSSFPVDEVLSEIVENKESQISQSMFTATENKENSNANLEANQIEDPPYALWPLDENGKRQNSTPLNATPQILEEVENHILSKMHDGQTEFTSFCSPLLKAESVSSSFPVEEVLSENAENKEAQTPQSMFAATENKENSDANLEDFQISSEKELRSCNIWSRSGKPAVALQLQTRSTGNNEGPAEVEWEENQEDGDNRLTTMTSLCSDPKLMEESFTPDKENYRPNTLMLKSIRRKGKPDEIQTPNSCTRCSSNIAFSPSIHLENLITLSDKENQTPKCLHERKSTKPASNYQRKLGQGMVLREIRSERLPLRSLLAHSPGRSISEDPVHSAATSSISVQNRNSSSIDYVLDGKRRWIMVVDTSSLLDKKSRMSLQLLQGLKGTQLAIPRMVIKELDCLKRRGSLFRRTSEASLALEWIEECMSKTNWWIHIQSSEDDRGLTAPTPPACPQSRFSQGSGGIPCGTNSSAPFSAPFSAYVSLLEIASPTAEDHILDYALSCRRMNNNGRLVLISNDVTLKIKAMAEGLSCETAQEFRDSLVNPFSERFLWADSSPRGLTWSVLDDVVLKEWFYQGHSMKLSKGAAAKGLKLILLHNSHYGQKSDADNIA